MLLNEYEGIPVTTLREIVFLKGLNHPCIVKLLDFIIENWKIYLIFEFHDTDLDKFLKKWIKQNQPFDQATIKKMIH